MKIIKRGSDYIIEDVLDFDLEQTLECGQCFRYQAIGEKQYIVISGRNLLCIRQEAQSLVLEGLSDMRQAEYWFEYFDLGRDYDEIKTFLKKDKILLDAINAKPGIRILNQDFHEILLTFIISQNKQIPHIKKIVNALAEKYGDLLGELDGVRHYAFPTLIQLVEISETEFRECKTGFRAPYLCDAVNVLKKNNLNRDSFHKMTIEEARDTLMEIRGVGEKIANCVLLFGLGYRSAFPIDVWIKRIMEELYFGKDATPEEIKKLAEALYGKYGGYAQQYLFYYGRENKIGKKTR